MAQGLDISQSMLDVAVERGVDGDVALADMGQGLPLRGDAFDGVISISAVQVQPITRWRCLPFHLYHHSCARISGSKLMFRQCFRIHLGFQNYCGSVPMQYMSCSRVSGSRLG